MIIKLNLQLRKICLLYTDAIKWNDNIKCKKYVDNVEYINRETWVFFYSWNSHLEQIEILSHLRTQGWWEGLIQFIRIPSLFSFQRVLCFSTGWTTSDDVRQNWHKIEGEIDGSDSNIMMATLTTSLSTLTKYLAKWIKYLYYITLIRMTSDRDYQACGAGLVWGDA